MQYSHNYNSPLGKITILSDGAALTGLWFDEQHTFARLPCCKQGTSLPIFDETDTWLNIYFAGQDPGFIPALNLSGTEFCLKVWNILLTVPYGQTVTYGEIAKKISPDMSAQAVGNAVKRNNIALIVPCHRVIGAKGNLVGYAGGAARKAALLQMEQLCLFQPFSPKNNCGIIVNRHGGRLHG